MSRVSPLFDLQQIDSGLDRRLARLRQIDEARTDPPDLIAARAAVEDARASLTSRQAALRNISHEAEDTSLRLKAQEKRLYDGSIKNPKELSQVSDEVGHLKSRLQSFEDSVLEAMMLVEEAEQVVSVRSEELDLVEKERQQFVDGLLEEKDKLIEQGKVLQVKRQRQIAGIPWEDLQVYERLRKQKGGVAVAAVQEGLCGGCRVAVPAHVLRTARTGSDLTLCPSCGRILYPTGEVKFKEFDHNLDNIAR